MSGKSAEQQDNSIEEILASIRQIISEDDPKKEEGAVAEPVPQGSAPEPEPAIDESPADILAALSQTVDDAPADEPVAAETSEDDVFELVDRVIADETEPVAPEPEPVAPPPPPPPPPVAAAPEPVAPPAPPAPVADDTPIFTEQAATATLGAFSKLSETVLLERQRAIAGSNVTLEDIVKELLQPLLRQWIDQNVPGIVDRLVREELEKLSRQAREG